MGRYKRDLTFYNNRWQPTEYLIADAYTLARRKPEETIEIAAHLMSQAFENQDDTLMDVARDLMRAAGSPCQFKAVDISDKATDINNRPSEPIVPDISADLLNDNESESGDQNSKRNVTKLPVREITWEAEKQCFKAAVLHIMELKKEDGDYLFTKNAQWIAVYRFAIDIAIMYEMDDPKEPKDSSTPQYKKFEDFANELQLDVNPPTRIPFSKNTIDSINSNKSYVRYNTRYPWSNDGITDPRSFTFYTELEDVYLALEKEYNNFVSQAERTID